MKNRMKTILLLVLFSVAMAKLEAQSYEVQCLVLDCSKLAQLKSILTDMKKGYQLLTNGYNTVKDISEGNFHLHQVFLDNLMKVSPVVRNYERVAGMISDQIKLVKEYKSAWQRISKDKNFTLEDLQYIRTVYGNLIDETVKNLDDLTTVISPGVLRMNDEERLRRIDQLADDMHDKLTFLRHFNNKTSILSLQRAHEQNDANTLKHLYQIK